MQKSSSTILLQALRQWCSAAGATGIYLKHVKRISLAKAIQRFAVFTVHACTPYIRDIRLSDSSEFTLDKKLTWVGFEDYMDEVQSQHAADFRGPFVIGVWWQKPSGAAVAS